MSSTPAPSPSPKPIVTKRNVAYAVIFFALAFAGVWISGNKRHLTAFPSIISSFYSKEFCSCYFVMGRDEETCHNFARQWVPISDFQLTTSDKTVTVSGLGRTTTTRYIDKRNGCSFDRTE